MKTSMIALALVVLAGSGANAQEYFDLSTQRIIRQKSISAYNSVPSDNTRRNPPAPVKPYTPGERSLFQRLLRWE